MLAHRGRAVSKHHAQPDSFPLSSKVYLSVLTGKRLLPLHTQQRAPPSVVPLEMPFLPGQGFSEQKLDEEESESKVAQSCPTLCNPLACSLPGSSVSGILQARTLEWVAMPSPRGSSRPRDGT